MKPQTKRPNETDEPNAGQPAPPPESFDSVPKTSDAEIKKPVFKMVPIEQLNPYHNNPRKHTDLDVKIIMHSLAQYGWRNPVQIEKGTNVIVAGHGRVEAAKRLGLKMIPCVEADDSETNHRGYRIMDNRSAELSDWDNGKLNIELVELDGLGFNLGFTGFSEEELKKRIVEFGLAPEAFQNFDNTIATQYACPKCGYEWSGQPNAGAKE